MLLLHALMPPSSDTFDDGRGRLVKPTTREIPCRATQFSPPIHYRHLDSPESQMQPFPY